MSSDDPGIPRPRKHRLTRWLKRALFFCLLPIAVIWLVLFLVFAYELHAELGSWQAKGRLTELHQIIPDPIPDEENAATLYEEALSGLGPALFALVKLAEQMELPSRGLVVPDTEAKWLELQERQRHLIAATMRLASPGLEAFHQAGLLRRCRFEVDPERLSDADYVWTLHHLSVFVADAAHVATWEGEPEKVLGYWQDILALARHLSGDNRLTPQLMRAGLVGRALDILEGSIQAGLFNESQLARIAQRLDGIEARQGLAGGLQAELVWMLRVIDSPTEEMGEPKWHFKVYYSLLSLPYRRHDAAVAVRLLDRGVDLCEIPYYSGVSQIRQWEKDMKNIPWWRAPLTSMFLPALAGIQGQIARWGAELANARTAVALERHRIAHGRYPDSLSALVPEFLAGLPVDPFSGRPLLYVCTQARTAVYSVGEDLKDDGGSVDIVYDRPTHKIAPRDIVFVIRKAAVPDPLETEEGRDAPR